MYKRQGDIPVEGDTYSVTLTGLLSIRGTDVRARIEGEEEPLAEGKATTSGSAVELAVPANEGYDVRTVVFEYRMNGTWTQIGDSRSQAGYSVSNATHNAPATIPTGGGTYSVTLTGILPASGVDVRATSGGTALVTGKVTASRAAVSLTVPANTTGADRTVTFEYLWNGTWTKIGDSRTQQGYVVTNATHNAPATISGQGGSYNVTLTGTLPAAGVAVRAQSGGTAIVSGTVTKSGTAVLLTVPGNLSYNNRSVTFEYNWNGTWTKIGAACSQQGWNVTKASVSPAGDIPGAGGTYTVTLMGWGGYQIRATSGSAQLVIKTDFTEVPNYSATIQIPANPSTGSSRTVTFQYRCNGKWVDIDSRTQRRRAVWVLWNDCNSQCASLGGIPSVAELKTMDWTGWQAPTSYVNRWWSRDRHPGAQWYTAVVFDMEDWSYDMEGESDETAPSGCRCLND